MKLYLVEMSGRESAERFYKIGVTNYRNTMHRFTRHGEEDARIQAGNGSKMEKLQAAFGGHLYAHPYSIAVKHEVVFETEADAKMTEAEILQAVSAARYEPIIRFPGSSECFRATDAQLAEVVEYMTSEAAAVRSSAN